MSISKIGTPKGSAPYPFLSKGMFHPFKGFQCAYFSLASEVTELLVILWCFTK